MFRIITGIRAGVWAFRNPQLMGDSNLKLISGLYEFIMKVAEEGKPYMTHISHILPDEGDKHIVSLWAGAGLGAEPTKRIAELLKENAHLKARLARNVVEN